jgi:hypothetical protein
LTSQELRLGCGGVRPNYVSKNICVTCHLCMGDLLHFCDPNENIQNTLSPEWQIVDWNVHMPNLNDVECGHAMPNESCLLSIHEIETEMWQEYQLTPAFLDEYIQFATQRTCEQIKNNVHKLPPGYMDETELKNSISSLLSEFNALNHGLAEKMHTTSQKIEELRLLSRVQNVTNPELNIDYRAQRDILLNDFKCYVNRIYELRLNLMRLSTTKPLDSNKFHKQMHEWQYSYMFLKLQFIYPDIMMGPPVR